jgi:protein-S-isoprenylcysteine O-methyltransferase Ste14
VKEFAVYTALRLALFLGSFAIVFGAWFAVTEDVPVVWAVVLAFVMSGIGSYFLLSAQREAFARRVETRASAATARFAELKAKEDADDASSQDRP